VGVAGIRDTTHVYHLFVAEAFHRQGLATSLWEIAKAAALAAGNPGRFTVYSSLHAVPVYERFGFRATGPEVHKHGVAFVPMELDESGSGASPG
jgi:GNAT superfamily N-acetyltransferase